MYAIRSYYDKTNIAAGRGVHQVLHRRVKVLHGRKQLVAVSCVIDLEHGVDGTVIGSQRREGQRQHVLRRRDLRRGAADV